MVSKGDPIIHAMVCGLWFLVALVGAIHSRKQNRPQRRLIKWVVNMGLGISFLLCELIGAFCSLDVQAWRMVDGAIILYLPIIYFYTIDRNYAIKRVLLMHLFAVMAAASALVIYLAFKP